MLIQFNGRNFKSYKGEFSLDMRATSFKEHPENLIIGRKKEKTLKISAIYGPNGSGKSNIFEALNFMKYMVKESFKEAGNKKEIPVKSFAFDNKSKKDTSEFEVFFSHNEGHYQYGFILDKNKIHEEWLYKRDFRGEEKYNLIFEREGLKFELNKQLEEFTPLMKGLTEKSLLLSFLSNLNLFEIKNVYDWFNETFIGNFGHHLMEQLILENLPVQLLKNKSERKLFENYLHAIDVGIEGLKIEDSFEEDQTIDKIYSIHRNSDTNEEEYISLREESDGTLKMVSLYSSIRVALHYGRTLLIDEMDAKLHPLLTKYIIKMFLEKATNPNEAQLIFTTHDVTNLTKDLFRRDEIWFVEKDKNNESSLYSLAEYKIDDKKIRNDASYNKDYLHGRYGAVPILKEFRVGGK